MSDSTFTSDKGHRRKSARAHRAPAIGCRSQEMLQAGASVVFSGDSDPNGGERHVATGKPREPDGSKARPRAERAVPGEAPRTSALSTNGTLGASPETFRAPETSLYYVRARYYDPEVGRWLSIDPLGLNPGDAYFVQKVKGFQMREDRKDSSGFGEEVKKANPVVSGHYTSGRGWPYSLTGLELFGRRWDDATTGNWVTVGPKSFASGTDNLYGAMGNDPTNATDPSGLAAQKPWITTGHHWFPVNVAFEFSNLISNDAKDIAMGDYSGYLGHHHDSNRLYGGVSHADYDAEVRSNFVKFTKDNNINKKNKMTGAQMEEFLEIIKAGRNVDGSVNEKIRDYNAQIRAYRTRFLTLTRQQADPLLTTAEKLQRGRDYTATEAFQNRVLRSRFFAGVAVLVAASKFPDSVGFANEMAENDDFRKAMMSLAQGDIAHAEESLFGPGGAEGPTAGFYLTLSTKFGLVTAELFRKEYLASKEIARQHIQEFLASDNWSAAFERANHFAIQGLLGGPSH